MKYFRVSMIAIASLLLASGCFETKTVSMADPPSVAAEKRGLRPGSVNTRGSANGRFGGVAALGACDAQSVGELGGTWYEFTSSSQGGPQNYQPVSDRPWFFGQDCVVRPPENLETFQFRGTGYDSVTFVYSNGETRECRMQIDYEGQTYLYLNCSDGTNFLFMR